MFEPTLFQFRMQLPWLKSTLLWPQASNSHSPNFQLRCKSGASAPHNPSPDKPGFSPWRRILSSVGVHKSFALLLALTLLLPAIAPAQQPSAPAPSAIPQQSESVVVTGTFIPAPLSENDRSVDSIDTTQTPLLFTSDFDYLRLDPDIDLQQRAPNGVQGDLTILGSTFAETLVLLDGLRMNDAQTAHHNLDIPIPIEAISRLEILHGAGSTFYGADAMGGAVNFITAPAHAIELRLLAGVGNQGFNQQHMLAKGFIANWSETIAADRDFSTGFIPDRNYRNTLASSETTYKSLLGLTDVIFAGSDRPFGANDFYGDYPSYERTKNWFASAQQDLGRETAAAFGFRRHTDEFILFRDDPAIYENNHIDQSWQAALRRHQMLRENTTLSYGAEAQGDSIQSNNLGDHARNREAVYGNVDFRDLSLFGLRHFSFSAGALAKNSLAAAPTSSRPTVAGGVWLKTTLKLHASVSRGFRIPTYTDLYYSDPTTIGNPLLKPESAWSLESGAEWNPSSRISAAITFFQRWDHNLIDYVQYAPGEVFQATNIDNLHFTGVEANATFHLAHNQQIELAYTLPPRRSRPAPHRRSLPLRIQLSVERSGIRLVGRVARFSRSPHPRRRHPALYPGSLSRLGFIDRP